MIETSATARPAPPQAALPPAEVLYAGLVARDATLDGRVWVGVTSTGIFCRPVCPARTPKPENCRWFASTDAALAAGFRPCRRCFPLGRDAAPPPPSSPPPRRAGPRRDRSEPGFAAPADLAAALAAIPARSGEGPALAADWIETPLGAMVAVADDTALHLLEFADLRGLGGELRQLAALTGARVTPGRSAIGDLLREKLAAYFAGRSGDLSVPLAFHGTGFEREVWQALCAIPCGQTTSYGALARQIGRPRAVRAVAGANGRNRLAVVVPCHRVIGADGSLTGYAGGLGRKQALIDLERRITAAAG